MLLEVDVPLWHRTTAEIGSHQSQQTIYPHVSEYNRPAFTGPAARGREKQISQWPQLVTDNAASGTVAGDMERRQ
jgi:hypothetical protein